MIEGRDGEQRLGRNGMDPVGDDKGIAFALSVAQSVGAVIAGRGLVIGDVGIVRNIEVVLAVLRIEPELVLRRLIANQRDKSALGVGGVVRDGRDGRGQTVVAAGAGEACGAWG